jgi:hypothetical protein
MDLLVDPFVQGIENLPFVVLPVPPDFEPGMEFEWHISTK